MQKQKQSKHGIHRQAGASTPATVRPKTASAPPASVPSVPSVWTSSKHRLAACSSSSSSSSSLSSSSSSSSRAHTHSTSLLGSKSVESFTALKSHPSQSGQLTHQAIAGMCPASAPAFHSSAMTTNAPKRTHDSLHDGTRKYATLVTHKHQSPNPEPTITNQSAAVTYARCEHTVGETSVLSGLYRIPKKTRK